MNDNGHKPNLEDMLRHSGFRNEHKFHWKRIHHTWGFWIGVLLIFVATMYYVVSVDFAFAPHKQMKESERTTTP